MAAKKKKKGAPKDPTKLEAKLRADPNTAKIAEKLGVGLEAYVAQVMHFVKHPDAEPQVVVADDDDLRKAGFPPPDADAMGQFLIEAAATAMAADSTGYDHAKGKGPLAIEQPPAATLDSVGSETEDPHLKAELSKQLRKTRSIKR